MGCNSQHVAEIVGFVVSYMTVLELGYTALVSQAYWDF